MSASVLAASTCGHLAGGTLFLALPVAFVAGLISFFSPCVLPLVPGYLSYVTGLSGADLAGDVATSDGPGTALAPAAQIAARRTHRVLAGSVLFVLGFSVVFIGEGTLFGHLGNLDSSYLLEHQTLVNRVGGVLTILLGVVFLGVLPRTQREWRVHPPPPGGGGGGAALGGGVCGGWGGWRGP